MGFETEKVKSTMNATSYASTQIAAREGSRSKATNSNVWSTYSIVGMDVTKVNSVRDEIDRYVTEIEDHVNKIDPTANANVGFKSDEVQAAVRQYIDKVKTYCINLCSQLRAFSDKLEDAKNAWEKATSNMSSAINSTKNSFDAGSKYAATSSRGGSTVSMGGGATGASANGGMSSSVM